MYSQSQSYGNTSQTSGSLQEQDWGNLLLSELKRTAREYTTAALEATHPAIRQTFQTLAQKTMQEQAELFDVLSQLNGYGSVKMASSQEIQQDLQQQVQKTEQLQSLVQQAVQGAHAQTMQARSYQQHPANTAFQPAAYPSQQSFGQQNQSYQQPSFQPASSMSPTGTGAGFGQGYGTTSFSSTSTSSGYGAGASSTPASVGYTKSALQGYGSQSMGSTASAGSQDTSSESRGAISSHWGASSTSTSHGGNSFDWNAPEESDTSRSSVTASDKATGHNSKYQF